MGPTWPQAEGYILGVGAKQFCEYHIIKDLKYSQRFLDVELGRCVFTEDKIAGMITYSPTEVREHPEYMSDDGSFTWDLRYDIRQDFVNGFNGKEGTWSPTGIKTVFAGSVVIDGREYNVIPKSSFGYVDRFWGESLPESWVHLSASHLTSIITGRILEDSSFAIQGIFNNKLSVICNLGDDSFAFSANQSDRKYTIVCDCSQTPENESEKESLLHWSISLSSNDLILDIDIFSNLKDLANRSLELSEGNRALLNLVQSGYGTGEFKLYKKVKKSIEQIEYAKIESAFCEFGKRENQ